jgi:hypothetical protein
MTTTESRYYDTLDSIQALYGHFSDGIDPDFDGGLEELECQLAELRYCMQRN